MKTISSRFLHFSNLKSFICFCDRLPNFREKNIDTDGNRHCVRYLHLQYSRVNDVDDIHLKSKRSQKIWGKNSFYKLQEISTTFWIFVHPAVIIITVTRQQFQGHKYDQQTIIVTTRCLYASDTFCFGWTGSWYQESIHIEDSTRYYLRMHRRCSRRGVTKSSWLQSCQGHIAKVEHRASWLFLSDTHRCCVQ